MTTIRVMSETEKALRAIFPDPDSKAEADRTPDLSWRPAVAVRVECCRLRRRITRADRALVALVLGMLP